MRDLPAGFIAALQNAPETGLAPVFFFHVRPRDRATGAVVEMSFWTGGYDLPLVMPVPEGPNVARAHIGDVGLKVGAITYGAGLKDRPVSVTMSQIADAAQAMLRGFDLRAAYCEIHVGLRHKGALASDPVLMWVGMVDEAPLATPAVGGEGSITLSVRSEIMTQLQQTNPAKSSDAHQRRRAPDDAFGQYASTVSSRALKWYEKK